MSTCNCPSCSVPPEDKEGGPCLAAGVVTRDAVRVEGLRLVNYDAIRRLGNGVDGTGIDKASTKRREG